MCLGMWSGSSSGGTCGCMRGFRGTGYCHIVSCPNKVLRSNSHKSYFFGVNTSEKKEEKTGPWRKARISTPEKDREALGLPPQAERPKRRPVSYLRFSSTKQADGGSEDRQTDLTDEDCKRECLELENRG